MRAVRSVFGLLKIGSIHVVRLKAVAFAVEALIHGGRLSLTAIGRAARGTTRPKHSVKRVDRLLGNEHLNEERPVFAAALAEKVLNRVHPLIAVDWTKLDGRLYALVAAIPIQGRAVPLYAEVHDQTVHGTPQIERRFLERLATCIPDGVRPIIMTDAGFRTPWFRAVRALDWDYVGRLQGAAQVCRNGTWTPADKLSVTASPTDLGNIPAIKTARTTHRVICAKPKRGPKRRRQRSKLDQASIEKKRRRAKQNCVLVTSRQEGTAAQVMKMYGARWEIEEMFRDLKSARFGWGLEHARTKDPRRYEILLLLGGLAMLAVLLVGLGAEKAGAHMAYQANTIRNRRVLSLTLLGRTIIARYGDVRLQQADCLALLEALRYTDICGDP